MIISDFINVKNKLNFARIMVDGYKLPMQSVPITTIYFYTHTQLCPVVAAIIDFQS
jgi:hypothetical protein